MGVKIDGRQLHHLRFADDVFITPNIERAKQTLCTKKMHLKHCSHALEFKVMSWKWFDAILVYTLTSRALFTEVFLQKNRLEPL
ncbi:hypothetical protein DICVIV_13948, partial [Dictyocaulus viviparus]